MALDLQGFNIENIIILIIAIAVLYLALKFLKGVIRFILSIVLIFTLGISLYNIFIAQKPLSYEINRYKTDIAYFKDLGNINKKAYEAIKDIKSNKDIAGNVKSLDSLEKEAEKLNHSEESNIIHQQYISNFKKVVLAAKGYEAANGAKEHLDNLNELSSSMDISLKEILFSK